MNKHIGKDCVVTVDGVRLEGVMSIEIGEPTDNHDIVRTANHGMITGTGCKPPKSGKIEYVDTPILRGHDEKFKIGCAIVLPDANNLQKEIERFAGLRRLKFGFTERIIDGKKFRVPYMEDAKVIGMDFADRLDESVLGVLDENDYDTGDYDPPTSCFCNVGNAPCSWCEDPENWCEGCDTDINNCDCPEPEESEIKQIIFEDDPDIIKERKKEHNLKVNIKETRTSLRDILRS